MILPFLDGLDEVPASHRRICSGTIDAYAGRSLPLRRFVLTCGPPNTQNWPPIGYAPTKLSA